MKTSSRNETWVLKTWSLSPISLKVGLKFGSGGVGWLSMEEVTGYVKMFLFLDNLKGYRIWAWYLFSLSSLKILFLYFLVSLAAEKSIRKTHNLSFFSDFHFPLYLLFSSMPNIVSMYGFFKMCFVWEFLWFFSQRIHLMSLENSQSVSLQSCLSSFLLRFFFLTT